jgi:signal transduction histidine kinase/CheY-like chemotaxis protein/ligand-binding sensor domain-containing protein
MNPARPVLLALLAAFATQAHPQADTVQLSFRQLTIEDGLSQGMVNAMVQDRHGFLWFGTKDGLNRYDGYRFETFRHDPGDSTTIGDNNVRSLFEDADGRLWVGTDRGLDVFIQATATFHHALKQLVPGGSVAHQILQDRHGDLWMSRNDGLFKLSFTKVNAAETLPPFALRRILNAACWVSMDHSGTIWAGELVRSAFRIRPAHDDRDRLDSLHLDAPLGNVRGGRALNDLTGLIAVEDTARHLVHGLHKYGIARLDPATGTVRTVFAYPPELGDMRTAAASVDGHGRIWICAYSGTWLFEPGSNRMRRVMPAVHDQMPATNTVQINFRDRSGAIWIGSSGHGLLVHDPRTERFHAVRGMSCGPMALLPNGQLSITRATHLLSVYDPITGRWPLLLPFSSYLKRKELQVLFKAGRFPVQDANGIFWFNYGGLTSYDPASDQVQRHPPDPTARAAFPAEESCSPLLLDGDSIIWFGGDRCFGRYDRRTHHFRYSRLPPGIETEGVAQTVQVIQRAADGTFWLGTASGLLHHDPRNGSWQRFHNDPADPSSLSSNAIFSILPDPADPLDILWIGTDGGGLNRFDARTGQAKRYTTDQGLPNNTVYGVLPDAQGHLWMSTNKGLSRFSPSTGAFRNYTAADGLQGDEFNRYAYCKGADGTLWFGGVNGFNSFRPGSLVDDDLGAPVQITGIRLINRPVDFRDPDAPFHLPAHLCEGMTIPSDRNMVTFEFATMEFSAPARHQYQYKLEGFDREWIPAGTEHNGVYTNLDPGRYVFRVRGDNRDGIWNRASRDFFLVVLPPWWLTWWAWALYVVTGAGALLLYIRLRTGGLKRQKALLERTVAARTTELSRQKDEAEELRRRAEHSEQVKQQFLANMSHEIRTPMNAIMGMAGILQREPRLPRQQPYLDAISSSSGNLLAIVNQILDLSRIEAGRLPLELLPMDPRDTLAKVAEVMRFRADEKGLHLSTAVAADVPATVIGDPVRLHQVLLNLVGNAVKFTERGNIRLTMDVMDRSAERTLVRCAVHDTGIGIPADRIGQVFDEFMQAETDHARKFGGTGLGLAICKRLVEMQGGTISVESVEGKGSSFTVQIPYALVRQQGIADTGPAGPDVAPRTPATVRALRILLVEDHPLNVMVAQAELEEVMPKALVDVAGNGQQALDMVQAAHYDLVLMDVQMPVMDGYEATRAIRALPGEMAKVPIIAMTANVMRAEVERCKQEGMDGFIPKPFKMEQLKEAIERVLSAQPIA